MSTTDHEVAGMKHSTIAEEKLELVAKSKPDSKLEPNWKSECEPTSESPTDPESRTDSRGNLSRTQYVDVVVNTHRGATIGEYSPFTQIQLSGKKKVQYNVESKRDNFLEAHDAIRGDLGKLHVYEIPNPFDSNSAVGPSWQHGTLMEFFESCLSLEKDPDALSNH